MICQRITGFTRYMDMRALVLTAALAYAGSVAGAQTLGEPYFLMRITQGDASAIKPYQSVAATVDVIGLRSVTGASQAWFLESHPSFASFEAMDKVLSGTDQGDATSMVGVLRTGLSYRPDEAIKLFRNARYFQINVFRIRPGADIDFSELIRIRKTTFDSINLDRPELGYQIISGAVSGTYVFIAPLQSLRTLDNSFGRTAANPESFTPLRHKEVRQEVRQLQWEADITREHMLFRVEPYISVVTEDFAAADPEFWRRR